MITLRFFRCLAALMMLIAMSAWQSVDAQCGHAEPSSYKQPDGTVIDVHFHGTELYTRTTTADGYTVIFDPEKKAYFYADLDASGNAFVSTGRLAQQVKPADLNVRPGIELNLDTRRKLAQQRRAELEAVRHDRENWETRKLEMAKFREWKQNDAARKKAANNNKDTSSTGSNATDSASFAAGTDSGTTTPTDPQFAPPVNPPTLGNLVGLTILVDFSDVPARSDVTRSNFDDYCNKPGGIWSNKGSIYDYYYVQSNGRLRYNNNVTYYVRVPQPFSYYNNTTLGAGTCGRNLLQDAINVLLANGYDFSGLTVNSSNGRVIATNLLWAGNDSGVWAYGLWPHRSAIGPVSIGGGKYIYDYQCTNIGSSGYPVIGTFCHEDGHMIGKYPDYYDTDGGEGVGGFCLMGSGNYNSATNPANISSYLKFHSGWQDVVELKTLTPPIRLTADVDSTIAYKYTNAAAGWTNEYFVIENRSKVGGWEANGTVPDSGLLISHAHETGGDSTSGLEDEMSEANHYEHSIEQADGLFHLEGQGTWGTTSNRGDANDLFHLLGTGPKTDFNDTTIPNAKWWAGAVAGDNASGTNSGLSISNVSAAAASMTFVYGATAPTGAASTQLSRTLLETAADYGNNAIAQSFSICNGGGGTLSYTVSDDAAWLACSVASGTATTEADVVSVSYTTSALAAGTYTGTITVDGGAAGIKTISVTLTIRNQPFLVATPTSVSIHGLAGTVGPTSDFSLKNTGGGNAAYTVTKTQAWLSILPATGTLGLERDTIGLTFNATGLATGTYNDTITVTAPSASNSPITIPVTFIVDPTDMILTVPNGGENWFVGNTQNITWASSLGGNVKIELLKAGILNTTIAASAPNNGSYTWAIPGGQTTGTDYQIRITSVEGPTKFDTSSTNFTIAVDQLALALDTTGLTWSTSGGAFWFNQSTTTHDGVDAAESGNIADGQSTSMETTVVGPGTMTFWWKVDSESGYDFLHFYLNGVEQTGALAKISGAVAWVQKTVSIPAGSNVVKWTYDKDSSVSGGTDTAWVDQVVYTPSAAPEIAVEQPVSTDLTDGSATVDFGSVNTGSNTSLTFTIKNVGTADLTGITPTISGTNSADYTITTSPALTVTAGNSTTCVVRFAPGASGARTALLQIASDDANENPFDINLTGTGVGPGSLAVTPAGSFAPSGTYGGPFSSTQVYTLSNPGNTSINWTAAKTQTWVTLSAASGTLAAGANTTVTVSINTNANTLNAGSYSDTVTFTNTTNSTGNTTRGVALTVNPIPATVTLGNLAQTYSGSSKTVTVTTNPLGLANSVTYNGSATAPTNAGTYAVVATITAPNYSGSASGSLVIAKASQTITFNSLNPVLDNAAPFGLTATASSGLALSYTCSNTAVATVTGSTVTIVGLGSTTITASQAGNTNYDPAPSVGQTLTVVRSNPLAVTGGPYKVIMGQSLSLNGSGSEASYGNAITAYDWDLNNDGIYTDATGVSPVAISSSVLTSTWGMSSSGPNTIKLKVTDSAAKTSIVSTTVDLINALTWDANAGTAGQTNGAGAWLGTGLWWNGSGNIDWLSGSNANFGGPSTAGGAVTLASPTSVGSITFNTFTGTYTLGSVGQALTISGGINKTATSAAVTFVSPIVLGGNQTWTNNSAGALNVNDALNNGGFNLTLDGTGQVNFATVSSVLSGSGGVTVNSGLTKLGSGVAPPHTYSGDTNINGGVVMFANNFSPNSNININGGILESYWNTSTINALGSGPNQLRLTGGESGFSLNGNTGQTINLGNAAATIIWGSVNFAPTKLVFQSSYAQGTSNITFANGLDLNGATRTILVNGGVAGSARAAISGAISNSTGTAGLIKEGSSILSLTNNASAWNGTTTISDGLLDLGGINLANIGGGSGRNISVTSGSGIRFNTLSNSLLNRIVETTAEITVMTGATANNLDFSSGIGANLPNAFLGCWASNGAKTEYSGTITPASDNYRLAGKRSSGLLGIVGTNKLTGTQGLLVGTSTGGGRVELAGANDFSGNTEIRTGARLTLSNNLALQNSALDLGSAGGTFSLSDGTNAGRITGGVAAPSPTFGGLIGSRDLMTAFSGGSGGNNETVLVATAVTGFTLNPGIGKSCIYSGAITDFAVGTTITKTGAGTQVLSGAMTYTGTTTVSAGKLIIDGSLSNVVAALNVASGATLGGRGTIGRNVTIADTGRLEFDIGTNAATHNPLDISAGRDFTFSGTSVLTITSSGGASTGTYTLITGGNNLIGVAPATLNLPVGWAATVSISGNSLLLNVTSTTGGAGSLAVTGAGGLSASGYVGGPFSLNTIVYTLSNPGQAPMNWTAGKSAAWLNLSATSGTLAAGANTTVTVSFNATANSLSAGSYSDTVTFTNTTNSVGDTTRGVALTVNPLGTYTVSYNGNGNGSGTAPSNQIKTQGVNLTLSGPGTLVRSGYTFSNWNTAANGSGTSYASGATYTIDAAVTLYAQWTANTYTVSFDANGGDVPSFSSKSVTYGSAYGALATVTRTGYTFNGWFTAASGGTQVTAVTNVATASNHTLYAQWTADTSTVTFNSNGGDVPSPTSITVSYDAAYGALATVTRTGYTFNGWFTAASGGTLVTSGTLVTTTADHTLYAQWTLNTYTVTYNANGASTGAAPGSQTKTHDVNLTLATNSGGLVKTGYTYSGWNTAADGTGTSYSVGATYATNADLTLYAKWSANTYTVTFDANGGTSSVPTSKSVSYGSAYGALASTTRTGYSFNGWFTAASGGSLVTSGSSVTTASNHTLYAQWIQLVADIDVSRGAIQVASGSYDLNSNLQAGVTSKLTYIITNNGNADLTLANGVISGNNNCVVTFDTQPASTVAPSTFTSLILNVTPSSPGAWSFMLSITNNDPNESPYQWTPHGVAQGSTTIDCAVTADTYINKKSTNTSYGASTTIDLNSHNQAVRQGLIKFDLSGVPVGSTVTSASLSFTAAGGQTGSVEIFNVTNTWDPATATYTGQSGVIGTTACGSATIATSTLGTAVPSIGLNATAISQIQAWVDGTATNNGFSIKTNYSSNSTTNSVSLCSADHATTNYRPKLTITYSQDPSVAEIDVSRNGTAVVDGGTDSVSGTIAGTGIQLSYAIANLGSSNLTIGTPVSVSGASNCSVSVTTQPANTVAASSATNLILAVTPSASGAWSANISMTNDDTNEGPFNWTISGNAASKYNAWSGGVVVSLDSNSDGISNGVAWALGAANASSNAIPLLPTIDSNTDPAFLIYTYRRIDAANTGGNSAVVEYGSSLTSWTTAVHDGSNIVITETNDAYGVGIDKVEVKIKKSLAPTGKLFSRLKVVVAP